MCLCFSEMPMKRLLCLGLLWALLTVPVDAEKTKPVCRLLGELQKDLVCTPGSTDYVLKRGLVSDNDKTTGVTLRGCRITQLELESFECLPALQYLDLSDNKIDNLTLGILDGITDLTFLNLSYNSLSDIELGMFDQIPKLEVLDLKGNQIVDIELGVFDPLKKLRHLDLSNNRLLIRNQNQFVFDQSRHIQFMDFSRNVMSEAPAELLAAFQALDTLNLDRCFLKIVPEFATRSNLATMKRLIISTNQITALNSSTTFVNLIKIEQMDFTANELIHIDEDVFKSLKNLKILVLRFNRLKTIPETVFQNIPKLGRIDLSHNKLEYVPVNAFRGTSLKTLHLAGNRFSYLQNNFYLELKNSGASLTRFHFQDNPWQCSCLLGLVREMKRYKVNYNSFKYTGDRPVCVSLDDRVCSRHQESNAIAIELYSEALRDASLNIDMRY